MKNWSSSETGSWGGAYRVVYLDAHYEKVRVHGTVQDLAILKSHWNQSLGEARGSGSLRHAQ